MSKNVSKKLRLSDLILQGCKLDGPKIEDELLRIEWEGEKSVVNGACALGAAVLAKVKLEIPKIDFRNLSGQEVNALGGGAQHLPKKSIKLSALSKKVRGIVRDYWDPRGRRSISSHSLVPILNDYTDLSRESIARIIRKVGA